MGVTDYLKVFREAAKKLDRRVLDDRHLELATGEYFESVFLKLYKIRWANRSADPLTVESRIFFSIWVNDKTIDQNKIFYNIHALKLRQLQGFSITSRDFAVSFRKKFEKFEALWPNVSTKFGPLTLMQGWQITSKELMQHDIIDLSRKFIEIHYLVDERLDDYKKTGLK